MEDFGYQTYDEYFGYSGHDELPDEPPVRVVPSEPKPVPVTTSQGDWNDPEYRRQVFRQIGGGY